MISIIFDVRELRQICSPLKRCIHYPKALSHKKRRKQLARTCCRDVVPKESIQRCPETFLGTVEKVEEVIQWRRSIILTPPSLCERKGIVPLVKRRTHPYVSYSTLGWEVIACKVCGTASLHYRLWRIRILN